MPRNLVPHLIQAGLRRDETSGRLDALTMFMDISGFTPMTEALMQQGKEGAEILSGVINGVFAGLIDRVYRCGGMITGFAGDAFTAVFEHQNRGQVLAAARAIQDVFQAEGMHRTRFGDFQLQAKIGLSAGAVEWGVLGRDEHHTYYFRGPAVDGCAAAEHHCEKGQIVLDRRFYEQLDFAAVLTAQTDHPDFWLLTGIPDEQPTEYPQPEEVGDETARRFLPEAVLTFDKSGEFRNVFSLFIAFDETAGDEAVGATVTELLPLAANYGGFWGNLDFGDKGATLLVLFGAPQSHENDLERALAFALEAREKFGARLRMGITTGPVYAGLIGSQRRATYTAMGDVVNLSARLMARAEPGSLFASAALAEGAQAFQFESRGEMTLKGKARPQQVFELGGRAAEEPAAAPATSDFAGREEELAILQQCMHTLARGRFGGIVYLYGEAGTGKSRLVAELARREAGTRFVFTRADPILRKSMNPFVKYFTQVFDQIDVHAPEEKRRRFDEKFAEILRELKEANDPERSGPVIRELERTKSSLAALLAVHWEGSLHESLDAKGRFDNTVYAIKEYFKGLALLGPTALVLDDFHELDADSETILAALTRNVETFPLLVLAAGRYRDQGEKRRLELEQDMSLHEWDLQPLSSTVARRLVELRLEKEPDDELFEFIASRTRGNPFFIEQFCMYLLAGGRLSEKEGRYGLGPGADELPVGINSLLISRLDRLSAQLKDAVQVAAVMGQEFDTEVLTPVLKSGALTEVLGEGEQERIWRPLSPARFVFNNGLLRDAAYDMQLRDRLRKLHDQFARTMEELFPGDETRHADIAYHYEQAEVEEKAREYLFKAGRYALDNYKSEKALDYYERLLRHQVDADEKLQIHRDRARILELTGRWDQAIETLEAGIAVAFESRNLWERARLMTQMGALFQKKGGYDDAVDCLWKAAGISGDLGDRENEGNALLELGRAYWGKGDLDRALKMYTEALAVKEAEQDRLGIALAHYYRGVVDRDRGDYQEAMACYETSLKILEELGEKRYQTYPIYDIGVLYQYRGELDRALEYFQKARTAYEEIGYRSGSAAALVNLGVLEVRQGKFEEALQFYEESLRLAEETGEQLAIAYARFSIGAAHYMEGEYQETVRHFEEAFQIMKAIGAKGYYGYVYAYLTCLYARLKQPAKALKMALVHYKAIQETGSDVENGRTALGIALALATAKDGQALGENASQYLGALVKLAGGDGTAAAFFELAVARAREADYINTLVPALREFGQYLYTRSGGGGDEGVRALDLLREARERAAGAGMSRQLGRLRDFCAAQGIDLDA